MAITFLDSGSNATADLSEYQTTSGTISSSTDFGHVGTRSVKILNGYAWRKTILADAGSRFSRWVHFDDSNGMPNATCSLFNILTSAGSGVFSVRVKTDGHLILADGANTQIGSTGTATLTTGAWYRIACAFTLTSTGVNEFRVWVDGTLDITLTNGTLTQVGADGIACWSDVSNAYLYHGDGYVDDSAALTDPGDIRVTPKLPASNSTNAWNTNIGANPANRWTNVNERPLSITNGWEETALAAVEESYGIEAAAAGDVDLSSSTIVGHGAWIWAKGGAGGLGAPKLIRDGNDVAVTLTATAAYYAAYATSATYPSGVIGMKSAGVLDTTFLYETGMLIAYTPGTVTYDFTFINPWMISA